MAFYKRLMAFAVTLLLLLPTAVFAEFKYWQLDVFINEGSIDAVGNIIQRSLEDDYDPLSDGDYKISLLYENKLIAFNNFSIPENFEVEAINFDGTRSDVQSKSGVVQIEFKKPEAYQFKEPAERDIVVKIEKEGKLVKEEAVSVINYDNEPVDPSSEPTPPESKNTFWLEFAIAVALVAVTLGLWYWSNRRHKQQT